MLACIGDLMVDVFVNEDSERAYPGGKAAIYASAAGMLGIDVGVVGAVGVDPMGDDLVRAAADAGIDTSAVQRLSGASTGADYFESGEWCMQRGANWELKAEHVVDGLDLLSRKSQLQAVLVNQGVATEASEAAAAWAAKAGAPLIIAFAPEAVEQGRRIDPAYAAAADLVLVNALEAEVLARDLGISSAPEPGELAGHLVRALSPKRGLVLVRGPGAVVFARPNGVIEEFEHPRGVKPTVPLENSIGGGDVLVGIAIGLLFDRVVTDEMVALKAGIEVALASLNLAGVLTSALDADSPAFETARRIRRTLEMERTRAQ